MSEPEVEDEVLIGGSVGEGCRRSWWAGNTTAAPLPAK